MITDISASTVANDQSASYLSCAFAILLASTNPGIATPVLVGHGRNWCVIISLQTKCSDDIFQSPEARQWLFIYPLSGLS